MKESFEKIWGPDSPRTGSAERKPESGEGGPVDAGVPEGRAQGSGIGRRIVGFAALLCGAVAVAPMFLDGQEPVRSAMLTIPELQNSKLTARIELKDIESQSVRIDTSTSLEEVPKEKASEQLKKATAIPAPVKTAAEASQTAVPAAKPKAETKPATATTGKSPAKADEAKKQEKAPETAKQSEAQKGKQTASQSKAPANASDKKVETASKDKDGRITVKIPAIRENVEIIDPMAKRIAESSKGESFTKSGVRYRVVDVGGNGKAPVLAASTVRVADPPIAPQANGRYFIQVIATGNLESANRIAAKLQQLGLPVYLESVKRRGSELWRVRIGRFESREYAGRALEILALNKIENGGVNVEPSKK